MEKQITEIGFNLIGIHTEQFAFFEENIVEKAVIELGTSIEFKCDNTEQRLGCFVEITFVQKKKAILKIEVSCHFKIKPDAWAAFAQELNRIVVPKNFLSHLAMLTVGTTRGILFAKTENTLFNKFIVPTINVEEMIVEDVVFEVVTPEINV
ncbi:MAG: hypothetical protein ACOVNR_08325 [Chitinophagaceae bacterium]